MAGGTIDHSAIAEAFRLNERGKWELTPYSEGDLVQLASIDFECAIASIYEDVEFDK